LVAQRNVLGDEICAILENGSSNGEKQCKLERHSANDSLGPDTPEKLADSPLYRIVRRHRNVSRLREIDRVGAGSGVETLKESFRSDGHGEDGG
jgi:hypothetical protein